MPRLNQVIAVERGIKAKVQEEVDTLYKAIQKPALFDGFVKNYKKKADESESLPSQTQRVQFRVPDVYKLIAERTRDLFNVTAQKDWANCEATADIEVDGVKILTGVPTTFLLFLEKQLTDLHTIVAKTPTLDPAESWELDVNKGVYVTPPSETLRTKKEQRALVLYPATDKHPAQTQLITEDVTVGTWEQIKTSGAVPEDTVRYQLRKIEKLLRAVKQAREAANLADAPERDAGNKIMDWLFTNQ